MCQCEARVARCATGQRTMTRNVLRRQFRIRVGVNYPWLKQGWDFGEPVPRWGDRAQWKSRIDQELTAFRELGIFAVRWFILGDGTNYGMGSPAPRCEGRLRRQEENGRVRWVCDGRWEFDPLPLSQAFQEDFRDLLERFARAGIQLVPCLIGIGWSRPGFYLANSDGTPREDIVKGGRADVINNPAKRRDFLDWVLQPLLEISQSFSNVIYAWELINEPEFVTRGSGMGNENTKTVEQASMFAFIREGIGRINSVGFKSTVGFAKRETISQWRDLGVTLHQFHYYPRGEELPYHNFHPNWPCFMGEFATNPRHIDENGRDRSWPELGGDQNVNRRLQLIAMKGYPSAFLWSVHANDSATSWTDDIQRRIRQYTHGF